VWGGWVGTVFMRIGIVEYALDKHKSVLYVRMCVCVCVWGGWARCLCGLASWHAHRTKTQECVVCAYVKCGGP